MRWGAVASVSLGLATALLVSPIAAQAVPLMPVAKKKAKAKRPAALKCEKGQAKVTVRRKGRKARKTCLALRRSGKPLDDLMRRAAERGVPRKYRKVLKSKGARRVRALSEFTRISRSAALRPGAAFRRAGARTAAGPDTVNTVRVIKDTGSTKVTKRDQGTAQVSGDGVLSYDRTATTETVDKSGVRATESDQVVKSTPQCPDASGQIKGRFRYVNQKVAQYPTGDGGRVVVSAKAEFTVDYVVQVSDAAALSSFESTENFVTRNETRRTGPGKAPDILHTASGSGSGQAGTGTVAAITVAPFTGTGPSLTTSGSASPVDVSILYLAMRTQTYSLVKDEVAEAQGRWQNGGCVQLEASPGNLQLASGATGTTTVKLRRQGAPFDGQVKVMPGAGLLVSPGALRGPDGSLAITNLTDAPATKQVALEHRSRRGVAQASVTVGSRKEDPPPPPPPPTDGPRYSGSITGSTLDSNTGLTLTWTGTLGLGFRVRYPTGQFGAPPGDYWFYANDAGTVNVTLYKPASDANDCEWNGSATLSISDPGGPSSSVQADDATPAYFLFVQPAPGQQIPFTKTGPQTCAGTDNLPIYGYVAWARTPTAQQSSSTTLVSSATLTEANKTENWSWSLSR